jgi:hypothetical protein
VGGLPKRQLLVIAGRFDDLPRRCQLRVAPRWAIWLECRATDVEASRSGPLLAGARSHNWRPPAVARSLLTDDSEISAWRQVVDVYAALEADFPAVSSDSRELPRNLLAGWYRIDSNDSCA